MNTGPELSSKIYEKVIRQSELNYTHYFNQTKCQFTIVNATPGFIMLMYKLIAVKLIYLLVNQCHIIMKSSAIVLSISSLFLYIINVFSAIGALYQLQNPTDKYRSDNVYIPPLVCKYNYNCLSLMSVYSSTYDAHPLKNKVTLHILPVSPCIVSNPKAIKNSQSVPTPLKHINKVECHSNLRFDVLLPMSSTNLLASSKPFIEIIYGEQSNITNIQYTNKCLTYRLMIIKLLHKHSDLYIQLN